MATPRSLALFVACTLFSACADSHCAEERTDAAVDVCEASGEVFLVFVPPPRASMTIVCAASGTDIVVTLFDEMGREISSLSPECIVGTPFLRIGRLDTGRYRLAIQRSAQTVAGGDLLGVSECSSTDSALPFCAPLHLDARGCAPIVVPFSNDCVSPDCGGGA